MKMRPTVAAAALALFLAGCATTAPTGGTSTTPPVPASFGNDGVAGNTAAPTDWRTLVADGRLRSLIELALQNNRDLRVATLNIDKARATYRVSSAAQGPAINTTGSATATDNDAGGASRQYSVSLGVAAWELDLWGRLGSLKDAALASVLATEQTQRAVQASLVAEVAAAWLQLSADQQHLALTQQTLASREQSQVLTERRHAAGAGTGLDVSTARAATETARGDLASLQASVAQDRNALRLLVGAELPARLLPGAQEGETSTTLTAVAADLPSSVLLQRPDVRAAELLLQAAQANVAAARAATFPTVSLTASAGTASSALSDLFGAGSGVWSFVPTIKLPIFDGGASQANLDSAKASREIQLASYEKTVQTAFKEAADALAARQSLADRLQAQRALVGAYETNLRLATERQRLGSESPLAVLDAQRSLYTAQRGLIGLQLVEQGNRLTLFKALGGT